MVNWSHLLLTYSQRFQVFPTRKASNTHGCLSGVEIHIKFSKVWTDIPDGVNILEYITC